MTDAPMMRLIRKQQKRHVQDGKSFVVDSEKMDILMAWERLYCAHLVDEHFVPSRSQRPVRWNDDDASLALVHMVRHDQGPVYCRRFHELVGGWDVVSCSLIRLTWPGDDTIASVGFALRVPPQNIVGAHNDDVWFPNHVGARYAERAQSLRRIEQAALLSECLLTDVTLKGLFQRQKPAAKSLINVRAPRDLIPRRAGGHNEVLVVGKSNAVSLYDFRNVPPPCGAPQMRSVTGRIGVRFILINPSDRAHKACVARHGCPDELYEHCWRQALRLRMVNPQLAIRVVRCRAPGWRWSALNGQRPGDGFIAAPNEALGASVITT